MGLQRVTKEIFQLNYSNPKSFVNFLLPNRGFGEGWGGVKNLRLLQGLLYELHLKLGWVLLKQKQYQAAEKELRQAVAIDQAIEGKELGGGMAYCLLEDVRENKKDIKEQLRWKNMCFTYARPETIDEYKWFIETGKQHTADRIDTTGVVNGESNPSTQPRSVR